MSLLTLFIHVSFSPLLSSGGLQCYRYSLLFYFRSLHLLEQVWVAGSPSTAATTCWPSTSGVGSVWLMASWWLGALWVLCYSLFWPHLSSKSIPFSGRLPSSVCELWSSRKMFLPRMLMMPDTVSETNVRTRSCDGIRN